MKISKLLLFSLAVTCLSSLGINLPSAQISAVKAGEEDNGVPSPGERFEKLNTKASLNLTYSTNTTKVSLVKSTTELVNGDLYLIGSSSDGTGRFMSCGAIAGSIPSVQIDNDIRGKEFDSSLGLLKLRLETDSNIPNQILFYVTNNEASYNGYLTISDTKGDNSINVSATKDLPSMAITLSFVTKTFDFNALFNKRTGETQSPKIRLTSTSFTAPNSGGDKIFLYRIVNQNYSVNKNSDGSNKISLRFSGIVPMEIYDGLVEYYQGYFNWSIDYAIGSKEDNVLITNGVFVKSENDKNGVSKDEAGDDGFFRYSIVIDKIPSTKFDVNITAIAKISGSVGGTIYTCKMKPSTYSVNSIAKAYIDEGKAGDHVGVLTWLSTYKEEA